MNRTRLIRRLATCGACATAAGTVALWWAGQPIGLALLTTVGLVALALLLVRADAD